jgi:hypothetical protein
MADTAIIGTSVVFGVIIVLLVVTVISLMGGNYLSAGWANLSIMLSFLLVVLIIAIPFVEINVNVAGMADNKDEVKNAILNTIYITTGMFVCFLIVTLMILRKYPAKITTFINGFTMLSFLMSMIVLTIFTIKQI